MTPPPSKHPKARNRSAYSSLSGYFERIYHSLADRSEEYRLMRKYMRVNEEAEILLSIERVLDSVADKVYEIQLHNKISETQVQQLMQILNKRVIHLKHYLQGKTFSIQIQLLQEMIKHSQLTINLSLQCFRKLNRIEELIPIIKALLRKKDAHDDIVHDPVVQEITAILREKLDEPSLESLKNTLLQQHVDLKRDDGRLHFEHLNDVSDKLIGLLNDKLLVVIGVSEVLIEGVEDDGGHDVQANQRLPDELRVLFLANSTLEVLAKIKEIKDTLKLLFASTKNFLAFLEHPKLDEKLRKQLKAGDNNLYEPIIQLAKKWQIIANEVNEPATIIEKLNLPHVMQLAYSLVYEKSRRIWENPYKDKSS